MKTILQSQRGFTLIELLVVVAIIGLLASVVLASLAGARKKGADASIKQQLTTLATQAELYYSDNNYYTPTGSAVNSNVCQDVTIGMFGNPAITQMIDKAYASSGNLAVRCRATVGANGGYAVQARLVSPSTPTYFCVDSNGARKEGTVAIANGAAQVCP